jgi:hypothetical protein
MDLSNPCARPRRARSFREPARLAPRRWLTRRPSLELRSIGRTRSKHESQWTDNQSTTGVRTQLALPRGGCLRRAPSPRRPRRATLARLSSARTRRVNWSGGVVLVWPFRLLSVTPRPSHTCATPWASRWPPDSGSVFRAVTAYLEDQAHDRVHPVFLLDESISCSKSCSNTCTSCSTTSMARVRSSPPASQGGGGAPDNVRLLCRSHNRFAAEREYGRKHRRASHCPAETAELRAPATRDMTDG